MVAPGCDRRLLGTPSRTSIGGERGDDLLGKRPGSRHGGRTFKNTSRRIATPSLPRRAGRDSLRQASAPSREGGGGAAIWGIKRTPRPGPLTMNVL